MSDDVSRLAVHTDAPAGQALIIRPRTLPTTAQFAIETQLAWKLRNARGFLPNHFMVGDENERAAKILAAIEYARAVGIEPMIALQNTQVIDGKVGASALLIGALLRKAGYTITDDTNDTRSIVTVAKNGSSARGEFSMEDANRAQLVKPNSGWQKYPRDMMYARALTQAARRGAQDAVLGMAYTAEELGGIEEETAGVPVLAGDVRDPEPGVSEAAGTPPAAAIQPTPPAPSVEVPATPMDESAAGQAEGQTPPSVATPPPTAAVMPLAGPAFSRRMGVGRSVGPAPKRTNVVTAEPQAAEKPATVPADAQQQVGPQEPIRAPQAPPELIDEPVAAAPVEDGLAPQRELLRQAAAELAHLNAILFNKVRAPLENKEPIPVPPTTPTATSDAGLARLIDRDFPGRTLANLDAAGLQNRLELVDGNLAAKRAAMLERGITEE